MSMYLNRRAVRHALHVDSGVAAVVSPRIWEGCSQALNDAYSCSDTLVSMVPLYAALSRGGHRVLAYSGDVDGVVPTLATRRWVRSLGPVVEPWRAWVAPDGNVGGFTERVSVREQGGSDRDSGTGEVVFCTVRNAGHMVPRFEPERAFAMVQRFIAGQPL